MVQRIRKLLLLGDDAASEQEVIESIERGVTFKGAKLWILVIAVFVASLGLNTNSAAVIIGAMLISPLMGPIIGMGLGVGIYDFDLLRRSWRNFVIATLFSITTATVYFLITPINEARNELLARTSPTIYDVLIALCGGLAGIIAISSKSQRSGNVIPGVAIATALMPPLCTVGFGLATANWAYAAGAIYLFIINSIFIALATFIGAVFIMKFQRKAYFDIVRERRVKRLIWSIAVITIIPALILTFGMVRQHYFEQRVTRFIQFEMHFPLTHVISYHIDYNQKFFDVVMIGQEVDSVSLQTARERLSLYQLEDVQMQVIQGSQGNDVDGQLRQVLERDYHELNHAEAVIAEQQNHLTQLEQMLQPYTRLEQLSPLLVREMQILFPQVESITTALGTTADIDSTHVQSVAIISLHEQIDAASEERLMDWLRERTGEDNMRIIVENNRK